MNTDDLSNRLDKLEQNADSSVPDQFLHWGREEGLDDDEIRSQWEDVAAEAGDDDWMGVVWDWSFQGKLFDQ